MNRTTSKVLINLCVLTAIVFGHASDSTAAPAATPDRGSRPNILLILTDQQHAGMLSCAGNAYLKTPAMDSLARQGARFEKAYSANPVCVPSRVAMLTGRLPSQFGMQSNAELRSTRIPEPVQRQTMGRLLRDAGYETAYGGKTHLPGRFEDYGFEYVTPDQRDELADACAKFLKQKHDKPFLLVASFINPHDICYMAINSFAKAKGQETGAGPQQDCLAEALRKPDGMSETDFFEKHCPPLPANLEPPPLGSEAIAEASYKGFRGHAFSNWTAKEWRLHRWAYCRLTERVDGEIGRVLQALRVSGLEEKTVVMFTSDHGDMNGAHRLEHKSTFYEEAARVPFIVSYKGVTKPGLVDMAHVVSSGLDLIPTMCDYAGLTPPPDLKGRSVRSLAEGGKVSAWREYVVTETHYGRMVCSGRYKYCLYESGPRREQLVDLQLDPGEMSNLAESADHRAILEQHRNYLCQWIEQTGDRLAQAYVLR
jgi:arylsulfatase A-like enzyme